MKSLNNPAKCLSHGLCCSHGYGQKPITLPRTQSGIPKLLAALVLLVLLGSLQPLQAASGLAAPLGDLPVYADYDWEVREAPNQRGDGYQHVDTPELIRRLLLAHVSTYAYVCFHSYATDWSDFQNEFMPAAQAYGINVWLYLVPPSEAKTPVPPYGYDYVSWARAAGQLAQTYPNLKGICVDDFDSNEDTFTPSYVNSMMVAAHTYSPGMAFLPVNYDSAHDNNIGKTISTTFVNNYGKYCSGVIFPYLNMSNMGDYSGMAANISKNAGILGNIPMIVMIYDGGYGSWYPSTDYLTQANIIAQNAVSARTAKGIIQYKMDTTPTGPQFPIIRKDYCMWNNKLNREPAVIYRSNNTLELFVLGWDGAPVMPDDQAAPNSSSWVGFNSIGGGGNHQVVACLNAVNNPEAFVIGWDNAVWHRYWTGSDWSGTDWERLGGSFSKITAIRLPNGCIQVIGINNNSPWDVQTITQYGDGSWGAPVSIGGYGNKDICAIVNEYGNQELFVVGSDNAIWHRWWTGSGWSGTDWTSMGGAFTKVKVIRIACGVLEVYAIGLQGDVWHSCQNNDGTGSWGPWQSLGGAGVTAIAPLLSANGYAEVFVLGPANDVCNKWVTSSGWTPNWNSLGGFQLTLAVAVNQDGTEEVFGEGWDGAQWTLKQTSPGVWGQFTSMGEPEQP